MAPTSAAVLTWFHPPPQAAHRARDLLQQVDLVVVVDNTQRAAPPPGLPPGIRYLSPGENVGLAGALNIGVSLLPDSVTQVLFLDQDSELRQTAVQRLAEHLGSPDVAVAAALPWDIAARRPVDPRRRPTRLRSVDAVITSGMLVRRTALRQVGPFREEFFVDAVDLDMCLRLRANGWRILQDPSVPMAHALGESQWIGLCGLRLRSTRHPSWRLHAAARNGAVLFREHARRRPSWAVTYVLQSLYWLLTVVLLEPPRLSRAWRLLHGTWTGLRYEQSGQPATMVNSAGTSRHMCGHSD